MSVATRLSATHILRPTRRPHSAPSRRAHTDPGGSVGGQWPGTAHAAQGWQGWRAGRPSATGRASPGQAGGEAAEWGARGGGGHRGARGRASRRPRRPSHLLRRRSRFLPKRSDRRPRSAASPGRPGRRPSSRLQNTGPAAAAAAMETHRFRFRRETTLLTTACGDTGADTGRRARVRTAAGWRPRPPASVSPPGGAAGAGWVQGGCAPGPGRHRTPAPRPSPARQHGKWGDAVQTPRSSLGCS